MKRNMLAAMNRLEIDEGIRGLVGQLWKHCYRTFNSCEGHQNKGEGYVTFLEGSGDGWFEDNAHKYGLTKVENSACCDKVLLQANDEMHKAEEDMRKYGLGTIKLVDQSKACSFCGAGINGYLAYKGKLIKNPFKPKSLN